MEKKACWNCTHSSNGAGYSSVDAPNGSECRCQTPGFPWHIYRKYKGFEEIMPGLCGHYQPRTAGQCPECGAELGPVQAVEHWACGVFHVVPCCSSACRSLQQARLDAECDAMMQPVSVTVGVRAEKRH